MTGPHPLVYVGVVVVAVLYGALGYYIGVESEHRRWMESDMGDLCATNRHPWACRLHPDCEMQSLICFPNIDHIFEGRDT